jgi:hypothetical protein
MSVGFRQHRDTAQQQRWRLLRLLLLPPLVHSFLSPNPSAMTDYYMFKLSIAMWYFHALHGGTRGSVGTAIVRSSGDILKN